MWTLSHSRDKHLYWIDWLSTHGLLVVFLSIMQGADNIIHGGGDRAQN